MRAGKGWILALLAVLAWAAVGADRASGQQYGLRFSKSVGRMRWDHSLPALSYAVPVRLSAAGDSTSMLRITASGSLSSTLDERSSGRIWQDIASVSSSVNYPILGPRASIGIGAAMSVRNATLTRQKIRNQTLNFRFQYSPFTRGRLNSLRVNVTPGIIHASRANRANLDSTFTERGVQYSASLRMTPELSLRGQKLNPSLSLGKTDNTLKSNRNRSDDFSTGMGYTWPGQVVTKLNLSESRSQVGAPRSVVTERISGGAVVRDTNMAVELSASRNTRVSGQADFKVAGFEVRNVASYGENLRTNTASKDLDLDNDYYGKDHESRNWNLETSASGKLSQRLVGRTSVRYGTQDQRFLPVRLAGVEIFRDTSSDLAKRSLFLNGSLDWQLSERQVVKGAASVEVERGKNPGAPELDRDTHRNTTSVTYEGSLRSGMQLRVTLERSFGHKVNLDATHSSDNARNRDLGLNLDTRYERLGCSLSHTFGVSAKRTVYDFDRELNPTTTGRQSSIRRGWSTTHSLRRSFFAHLQMSARYSYRAEDFGRLLVENEVQVVDEDDSDHNTSLGMTYSLGSLFTTSVNYTYRLDRQWQYDYAGAREDRYLVARRPTRTLSLSIGYNPSPATRLSFQGSRSRQQRTFDSFSVSYSRSI